MVPGSSPVDGTNPGLEKIPACTRRGFYRPQPLGPAEGGSFCFVFVFLTIECLAVLFDFHSRKDA